MDCKCIKKSPNDCFHSGIFDFCDPAGARTQDPNIKSVVLYLLSYRVILRFFCGCKSTVFFVIADFLAKKYFLVQFSLALSKDNNLVISAIYYGTLYVFTCAAVYYDVDNVLISLINILRVGEVGVDFVLFVG